MQQNEYTVEHIDEYDIPEAHQDRYHKLLSFPDSSDSFVLINCRCWFDDNAVSDFEVFGVW